MDLKLNRFYKNCDNIIRLTAAIRAAVSKKGRIESDLLESDMDVVVQTLKNTYDQFFPTELEMEESGQVEVSDV